MNYSYDKVEGELEGKGELGEEEEEEEEGCREAKKQQSKVKVVVGGGGWWWYERIFVTVRLRLNCYQVFLGVV